MGRGGREDKLRGTIKINYYTIHLIVKKFIFTNKVWVAVSAFLLVASLSAAASYLIFLRKASVSAKPQVDIPALEDSGIDPEAQAPEDLKTVSFLLLGYGGPGHQGAYLADSIQLLHINFYSAVAVLISIPRDLWVELPNGSQAKINQALTLGDDSTQLVQSGGPYAKQMASIVTGLPVDYFIGVDFVGFQRLIGEDLGSIEVDVPEVLDDPWYPIRGEELNPCGKSPQEIADLTASLSGFELEKHFECRYEHLYFKPGLNKMEGGDALKYVRSRHGSTGGDFSRSQRQQVVLEGIKKKALSLDALDNAQSFFKTVTRNVTTDLDLELVEYLVPAVKTAADFETRNIYLSTENVLTTGRSGSGQFILIPKQGINQWQGVHQYIQSELN